MQNFKSLPDNLISKFITLRQTTTANLTDTLPFCTNIPCELCPLYCESPADNEWDCLIANSLRIPPSSIQWQRLALYVGLKYSKNKHPEFYV